MSALLAAASIGSSIMGGRRSKKNNKAAEAARKSALKRTDKFSDFADTFAGLGQDSYDRYTEMFGPVEDRMSEYYESLNPEDFAAQGNIGAQQASSQAMNNFNESMAARGLSSSGIQAQTAMGAEMGLQQQMAQNNFNAPHQVAQMQQGWMNYGSGRQDQAWNKMAQGVNAQGQAAQMGANANMGQAGQYQNQANLQSQSAGSALGAAGYFGNKAGWY